MVKISKIKMRKQPENKLVFRLCPGAQSKLLFLQGFENALPNKGNKKEAPNINRANKNCNT